MDPTNVLSICSGGGGLDLGVELALPSTRTVAYVEIEAYACAVLVTRMQEASLAAAPLWTNLKTFDGRPWRGVVDLITGGYPCQPFSVAGRQRGAADPRHLWPFIGGERPDGEPNLLTQLGFPDCFFENVANHLRVGFEEVHADLCRMGYRVATGLFTAEEVGSTHKRERLFIYAKHLADSSDRFVPQPQRESKGRNGSGSTSPIRTMEDARRIPEGWRAGRGQAEGSRSLGELAGSDAQLVHAESVRRREGRAEPIVRIGRDASAASADGPVAYATRDELRQESPAGADGHRSHCAGHDDGTVGHADDEGLEGRGPEPECSYQQFAFPPGPAEFDRWRAVLAHDALLAPALSTSAIESHLRGMADGLAPRLDRLRLLGNGVVPLEAAYAYLTLTEALA